NARSGGGMYLGRDAGAFAAKEQRVLGCEGEAVIGHIALRRQQDEAALGNRAERLPRAVPCELDLIQIIHAGALQMAVVPDEAERLDEIGGDPQAGAEAQNRAGVLRNIGLIKREPHWPESLSFLRQDVA